MKKFLSILSMRSVIIALGILASVSSWLQAAPPVLEISSLSGPAVYQVEFLNASSQPVAIDPKWQNKEKVVGSEFSWIPIPAGATQFRLVNLDGKSAPTALINTANNNTYVELTSFPGPSANGLSTKPFSLQAKPRPQIPADAAKDYWVSIGVLTADSDASKWRSLNLINADAASLDTGVKLTYSGFLEQIKKTPPPSYIVDFPLYLRSAAGPRDPAKDTQIARAGQRVTVTSLSRTGVFVYAKIKITG